MKSANPSLVIHMAAQSLVLKSYESPIETFNTNIIGTANVLEASSYCKSVKAIINVTSDKCYENLEKVTAYNESDNLGGHDPYSSSKACSELISAAYRNSFLKDSGINLATVRAGNVIGGGDWANDRLIPDFFRALNKKEILQLRYPKAIRPWQHVLEPISGYLMLAQKLLEGNAQYSDAWNFGPDEKNMSSVSDIIDYLSTKLKHIEKNNFNKSKLHETNFLKIDSSKARSKLGWSNKWNLKMTLDKTIQWYQAWQNHEDLISLTISQIDEYQNKSV
jgi:CDP-glucose 4,6-dehydratase